MRKIFSFFFTVIFLSLTSFSQVAIVPCGGDIIHTTGSVSYTVGQIDYVYKNTDSLGVIQTHSMWEGVQQVYPVLQLVYDTICPGSSYAENGFNVGPFPTPGLYVDTIFVASVVNAMVDTTIRSIPPDTVKVLYLTVRTLHTLTPSGYNITIIAGNSIPGQYSHTLGNGATSYNMQVRPNNSVGITTITVANSFIYGLNPLTQSGTYYVDFTTIGPGCPTTYTDTIIVLDSLLCEIVDVRKDNSCGQGIGTATAVPSGGSGVYTYLWEPSGQRTARATGLTAGTYVVTVTDHLLGQTVTDTVIIENDLFIITITADDTTLCGGESTQLYTQITGDDHQFLDYYWTTVGYSGPGTISGRYTDSPTVTVIGDTGQTRVYQVKVTDHHLCTATAIITIYIQCETAPSITWNILPNGETAPVPYDENLAIEISNPQPGNNIDADCGYLYRINGGPWLPWTNTSTPIMIEDNDIFEGEVTFEIKHNDTCSAGMIASYSWEITAPLGSISYVRDSWWPTVCISYDSLRLTNIVLQGFDSSTYIYEWMYAYHFLNGTQESSTWMNLTQLNDNVVNVNTPYIPVDASISQTPTQAGDTIFIFVRAQNTPDGGTTWVTVQTSQARWIIQADPSFDISPLIDGTICESQTHDFSIESSTAGAYTWSYGVAPLYTQNPITGTITEFDYQITSNSTASQLYLYDFNNVNSIEIIALLTPTNGSCPPYIDTALLTVYPEETLTLLTDSSTITQEFCLGNSIDEIRYVWGSGSDSAVLTWNNIPPGVQVTTSGDTLIISGTPTTIGTFLYSVATIGNCTPATATGSIKVNNLPNFTINASNIACHGDSTGNAGVNLYTLTGYEADYTFVWKDVASNIVSNSSQAQNLYAGTYTIEVTHNLTQCSTTDVITITEPASSVSPTVTYTDASCYGGNDGTISTIVNGGTPPYNIYIYDTNDLGSVIRGFNNVPAGVSKTSNNMTAGTYAVYVYDAHNCLFIEEITIASPSELNVDIIRQVDVTCYDSEDGIIEISVTGGTAPYQYFWSNLERTALITDLAPGNYNANITDNNGCETNITVFINRPPRIVTKDTVISCGTYTWNSVSYNNSGRYTQTFTASNGCDSTVTLYLTIIPNTHSDIHVSACGSYTWPLNHVMYTYSGTYSYTIVNGNAQGCDSTVYLHLSIDATATIETSETACGSYTWALNDSTYTQSGIYSHIVASSDPSACDTTYLLYLTINYAGTRDIFVNSCSDYTWDLNQITYNQSGTYSHQLYSGDPNSCDSIIYLHLYIPTTPLSATINSTNILCNGANNGTISIRPTGGTAPYSIFIYDTLDLGTSIRGYTNVAAGTTKTANNIPAGYYVVYIYDNYGCSYTHNVSITEPAQITSQFTVTECNSYTWEGTTYNTSGTYTKTFTAQNGCDSIVTLNLTISPSSNIIINVNACESYTWTANGQTYTQSGSYTHTIPQGNQYGCDSVMTLNLYIPTTPLTATINSTNILCNGANNGTISVRPNGGTAPYSISIYDTQDLGSAIRGYTNVAAGTTKTATNIPAGNYEIHVHDAYGCSYTYSISITEPAPLVVTASIVQPISCYQSNDGSVTVNVNGGKTPYDYLWNTTDTTQTITNLSPGTYTVTVTDSNLCTKTVSITITEPTRITSQFTVTECNSYTWEGTTYNTSGTYTKTLTAHNGCDSVVTLNLTISPSSNVVINVNTCNSYTWTANGQTYTQSGSYTHTIPQGNQYGCDSVMTLNLYIPTTPLTATINSTNILCNGTNNGTISVRPNGGTAPYSIYIYDVQDLGSAIRGYTNVAAGTTKTATNIPAGNYEVHVHDTYGCSYTHSISITEPAQISSQFTVTECNSYTWGTTTYNTSGTYTKTFTAQNGCDSVVTLNLTISPSSNVVINVNTCNSYTWTANGQTYTQSGSYTHTIPQGNQYGCDSVMTLNLYIPSTLLSANITGTDVRCYGGNDGTIRIEPIGGTAPYSILIYDINDLSSSIRGYSGVSAGTSRTATGIARGVYEVHVTDFYGCSYIQTITINEQTQLIATISTLQTITCYNGNNGSLLANVSGGTSPYQYAWSNNTSNSVVSNLGAGTYTVTATDNNGCTAITSITLTAPAQITSQFNATACNSYTWGGTTYNNSGTYTKTFLARNGCDSIVTLHLTINRPTTATVNATACQSYTWALNGQTYYQSGNYVHTMTGANSHGCDSIVTLNLYIPSSPLNGTITPTNALCFNANSGTITVSANGGTANYNISLYDINDLTTTIGEFTNIPPSTQRVFNNLYAGTYQVTITDNNGCTFTSNITLSQAPAINLTVTPQHVTCYGGTDGRASVNVSGGTGTYRYQWSNNSSTPAINGIPAGYYSVVVTDANNCTASGSTTIIQPNPITSSFNQTSCDSYTWNGIRYTASGSYINIFRTQDGCDSTVTLNLTITNSSSSHIYVTECNNYTWYGNVLNQSGVYDHTLTGANSQGCDSIVYLHLTINRPTTATVTRVACGSYTWPLSGQTYNQSGNYIHTIVGGNANGCDSIVTLRLTINQPTTGDITVATCISYTWPLNGQTYTQSGNYSYTIANGNAVGCDSIVTLHLTIYQPTTSETTIEACVSYQWEVNNETYFQSGDYVHTLIGGNAHGCDSIITLHLTINQPTNYEVYDTACVEYRWNISNETYYATGDYDYIVPGGNAHGCDSIITLHLTINQPSVHEITVITYNPYFWDVTEETYSSSGQYSYTYYGGAANGCDSTVILNLTINSVGIDDQVANAANISLYPNPTRNYVELVIDENVDIKEAQIFDIYGKLLKIEKIVNKHSRISFETYANGIYLLRLNNGTEVVKTFKVIKN